MLLIVFFRYRTLSAFIILFKQYLKLSTVIKGWNTYFSCSKYVTLHGIPGKWDQINSPIGADYMESFQPGLSFSPGKRAEIASRLHEQFQPGLSLVRARFIINPGWNVSPVWKSTIWLVWDCIGICKVFKDKINTQNKAI
jgi:hypothetical protein